MCYYHFVTKQYYVYNLASKKGGVLYVGVTNDLSRRLMEHKTNESGCFTQKYFVHRLVYVEVYDSPGDAIHREKNLKKWKRDWKIRLIEKTNPEWNDMSKEWLV